MLILEMPINEKLMKAESDINQANSDTIIEFCRIYLQMLKEYRDDLYKLRGSPQINLQQSSLLARELVGQVRWAIRSAVEHTTLKLNRTELLLKSFVSISGFEAVNTFNQLKYKGFDNWELKTDSVNVRNNEGFEKIAIHSAIKTASLLRREAYINDKTTFFREVANSAEIADLNWW